MCVSILLTVFPYTVFASSAATLSDKVSDSTPNNGVELTKSVVYDPATGKVTTTIETYTTGKVTSATATKPTDIIFVLDTSGSMAWAFNGTQNYSSERLKSMQASVNSFIDATATHNAGTTDPEKMHSIALISFASRSSVIADFTAVNESSASTLKSYVNALTANGATAVDYGLTDAAELLADRASEDGGKYAEREKVVIVLTDGDPTHGSSYSERVAYDAVNDALFIKSAGAKVYTIGIFNGADPSGTDESNVFMNYVSSNYPNAYGYTEITGNIRPRTEYHIAAGDGENTSGYYLTASDAGSLNNIFESISQTIGKPDIELGSTATLVDVVSDFFTIEGIGTNPNVSAQVADYLGGGNWDTPKDDNSVGIAVTGTDTITVNGFNFDKNYVSETARDGFYGKKLILTFVTTPNYNAIDGASFASTAIPTNDTAALLDSTGTAVEYVTPPTLPANKVTYKKDTAGTSATVAEYLRFPGASVTLIAKPADTAEYIYSEWTSSDITVNPGDTGFTMPQSDVVFTSTASQKNYTVSYEYRGTVPQGTTPSTAPAAETHAVNATVTLPTVTVPEGYVFSGWREAGDDMVLEPAQTEFTMPANDLHFYASFSALDNTYKVEHYLMDTNGNYPAIPDHSNNYEGVKTGDTVTATAPNHTGFTYDVTKTTAENGKMTADTVPLPKGTVLANGKLVLKVYYKRNSYTVTYQYDGDVPSSASPATDKLGELTVTAYYGETVDIADAAKADGYTFSGWRIYTGDTTISADGKMVMPNGNVILHGSFTANGDTKYYIEHYFENLDDDGYTLDNSKTSERTGKTDTTAYAEPLSGSEIIGFTYDAAKTAADGLVSGKISGDPDNPLVLKLYYSRTRHEVTYEYTGSVPASANPDEAELADEPYTATYKYGQKVTIADKATADGYTFVGWNIVGTDITVNESDNSFTMPARDVVLTGHFNPIPTSYTVQHYLENTDSSYTMVTPETVYSDGIFVNDTVTGVPNSYNTYTYDVNVTKANNPTDLTVTASGVTGKALADGALVIKLYYTRNAYDLTYRFENNPGNVTVPPTQKSIKHGTKVDLADITAPAGYTFDGWYYGETLVGDSLTMPRSNVVVVGRFNAKNDVTYTVKYYLQDLDGAGYTEVTDDGYTLTGTTGAYVTAATKEYTGFSFNTSKSTWNGHIKGDGSLVLELYYDRNSYTVTYHYLGVPPAGVEITLDGTPVTLTAPSYIISTETVVYGTPMTVKSPLAADEYEFRGWFTSNLNVSAFTELGAGNAYTMPAHNVSFQGTLYDYTVSYDLNGGTLNGSDTVNSISVDWNDADLIPDGTPVKDEMFFSGWTYESKDGYVSASDKYSDLADDYTVQSILLTAEYAPGYRVSYDWGTENIPDGVTLPTDTNLYRDGASYRVDTIYNDTFKVQTHDEYGNVNGEYSFSGWTDPSNGTISGASVVITGSWTFTTVEVDKWDVIYEWYDAPDIAEIPDSVLDIVNGATHTVDTTYTTDTEIIYGSAIYTFLGWDKSGTLTVTEDITIVGRWVTDVYTPTPEDGSVRLIKVDADDNSKHLANVVFELYGPSDDFCGIYTTDSNGEIFIEHLELGQYYFYETRSAEGYIIDSTRLYFTVDPYETAEVIVENEKAAVPEVFTGDHFAYIIGRDDGLVHPEANITRAEVATIFFRLLSEDTRNTYLTRSNSFTDVNEGDWYNTAISTMAAMGIVNGRPDNSFDPNAFITRAEFAAIAARFEEHGNTSDASFMDIYDHWAKKEINIAANNGWVLGYEDGTFKPDQLITRAEAMTMVNRVTQRIPESANDLLDDMVVWPDNRDVSKWYYLMIQEATNSHYYKRKVNGYEYWTELREIPDWTVWEK